MKWVNRERPKIDRIATALALASLVSTSLALPRAAGPGQPLVLEQKIPLGEVRGRIDHLAVDLARERLFVAELGNNSLGVVDLAAGKLLRRISGLDEPQGVAYDPATDTVFVADGGDGLVQRFEGADLAPLDPSGSAPTPTMSASIPRPAASWSATATARSRWSTPRPASRRLRSACPAIPSPFSSSAADRGSSSTCRMRIRSPWWIGPTARKWRAGASPMRRPISRWRSTGRRTTCGRLPRARPAGRVRHGLRRAGGTPAGLR